MSERTTFEWNGERVGLMQLLTGLRETRWAFGLVGRCPTAVDRAYDLTQARFGNPASDSGRNHQRSTNSRYYWRALSRSVERAIAGLNTSDPLEQERIASHIFRQFVVRHFRLACLEARRSGDRSRTRYRWQRGDGAVTVWLPADIAGRERRAWLERNVGCCDPARPGEAQRVQELINARLGPRNCASLGSHVGCLPIHDSHLLPLEALVRQERASRDLSGTIADEKADSVHLQRPAVRVLGPDRLRQLVLAIFAELDIGTYDERDLARRFHLSPATMSRFAGSRWRTRGRVAIPDLWRNVASVLAAHPVFVEAAQAAGVWPKVEEIIQSVPNHRLRSETRD